MGRDRSKSLVKRIASDIPVFNDGLLNLGLASLLAAPPTHKPRPRSQSLTVPSTTRPYFDTQQSTPLYPFSTAENSRLWSQYIDTYTYNSILHKDDIEHVSHLAIDSALNFQSNCIRNREAIAALTAETDAILAGLDRLVDQYNKVERDTSGFARQSQRLLNEQQKAETTANGIAEALLVFEALEWITNVLSSPGINLVKKRLFKEAVAKLDSCLQFVDTHPTYKDIETYKARFRQCMTRALTLVRNYLIEDIRSVGRQSESTRLETSLMEVAIYSDFRSHASNNQGEFYAFQNLVAEIEKRYRGHPEYLGLLTDVLAQYFSVRSAVVAPYVAQNVELLSKKYTGERDLVQLCQNNISFFKRMIEKEHGLFCQYFSSNSQVPEYYQEPLYEWFRELLEPLYDTLRNRIIRVVSITELCLLMTILQKYYEFDDQDDKFGTMAGSVYGTITGTNYGSKYGTTLGSHYDSSHGSNYGPNYEHPYGQNQAGNEAPSLANQAMAPTSSGNVLAIDYGQLFEPIVGDVQARLIFRVQRFVDDSVVNYKPRPRDLQIGATRGHRKNSNLNDDADNQTSNTDEDNLFPQMYSPVGRAMTVLSSIYDLINLAVFDDLAHHIVHSCIDVLRTSGYRLAEAHLGRLDAKLYYIRNLMLVQQQVNNFDIHHVRTETALDFTSGLAEILQLVRQGDFMVNYLKNGGFIELAKRSAPRVVNNMIDAKWEIDSELNSGVQDFIAECVNAIAQPLLATEAVGQPETATTDFRDRLLTEIPRYFRDIQLSFADANITRYLMENMQTVLLATYTEYYQRIEQKATLADADAASVRTAMAEVMEPDTLVGFVTDLVANLYEEEAEKSREDVEVMDVLDVETFDASEKEKDEKANGDKSSVASKPDVEATGQREAADGLEQEEHEEPRLESPEMSTGEEKKTLN